MSFLDLFRPKWKHSDRVIRRVAIERIGSQRVLVDIAKNDPDETVRRAAVERIDNQLVLVDIAKYDADETVRRAAVERIDDQLILADIAKKNSNEAVACAAVERINNQRALFDVTLYGSAETVRAAAVSRLEHFQATPVLLELFQTRFYREGSNVLKALDNLGWPTDIYHRTLRALVLKQEEELARLCPEANDTLITTLQNGNVCDRMLAAKVLGEIGERRAIEPLAAVLCDNSIPYRDGEFTPTIAEALGKIKDASAIEALMNAIVTPHACQHVAEVLIKLGEPRIFALLVTLLETADSPPRSFVAGVNPGQYLRKIAADMLGKLGDMRAVEPLVVALVDKSGFVSEAARIALDRIAPTWVETAGAKSAIPRLVLALNHGEYNQAATATWTLVKFGNTNAIEGLVIALTRHECGIAADTLEKIDPNWASSEAAQMAIPSVVAALKDVDSWRRERAAAVLGLIGNATTIPPLTEAVKDNYRSVREAALKSLQKLGYNSAATVQDESMENCVRNFSDQKMLAVLSQLCSAYATNNRERINDLEWQATEIGELLNARGGFAEMVRIFESISQICTDRRSLEMHWNGIGEWRG